MGDLLCGVFLIKDLPPPPVSVSVSVDDSLCSLYQARVKLDVTLVVYIVLLSIVKLVSKL